MFKGNPNTINISSGIIKISGNSFTYKKIGSE